ncbi:MAG: tRNA (adenine-N1)-methyltransferase [Promethearchaeota archaeon]
MSKLSCYFIGSGSLYIKMPIREDDHVVILSDSRFRWLVRIKAKKEHHTHLGMIYHDDLIGMEYGDIYKASDTGKKFILLKPLIHELATGFGRKTQIIYPKDVGYIILKTGITGNSMIFEAGTGSAAMTIMIGSLMANSGKGGTAGGKIISYEKNEKHHVAAKKNVLDVGLESIVDLRHGDIFDKGIQAAILQETRFDACILDLPNPWEIVDFIHELLKPCGVFCAFSPVIEQVKKTVDTLKEKNWCEIEIHDIVDRKWQVRSNATRPINHGHHTGFLTFARKINEKPPLAWTRKNRKELIRELEREGKVKDIGEGAMDFFDEG